MDSSNETPGRDTSDDDPWNVVLDEDFINAAKIKESPQGPPGPASKPKRVWPRNLALALGAAALTLLAFETLRPPGQEETAAPTPPATSTAPFASSSPSAAATASPGTPGTPQAGSDRPAVPLGQVFPAEVKNPAGGVYTRLGSAVLDSCTEPDSVGARLIAMIERSKGCVSHQVALYKDARNNQFNVSVFTMKDPKDTVRLVTQLTMAFDDYQVGAQAPPPDSGLPVLAADSGLIQAFAGVDRVMIASLGQWADGRTADFRELADLMAPLSKAVSKNVTTYETGT